MKLAYVLRLSFGKCLKFQPTLYWIHWVLASAFDRTQQRKTAHDGPVSSVARGNVYSFPFKKQALAFEHYLKSGSGHAFAKKRLWPPTA